MPISQWHTGCYWITGGRPWIVLEDGNAVEDGLHDLRTRKLAERRHPRQTGASGRLLRGALDPSWNRVGNEALCPPAWNYPICGKGPVSWWRIGM